MDGQPLPVPAPRPPAPTVVAVKVPEEKKVRIAPKRHEASGALIGTLTPDETLQAYTEEKRKDWKDIPGRYYYSKLGVCFRKAWYEGKKVPRDPDAEPYEDGDSEAGNAAEEHYITILRSVYGEEGTILKNVRFSMPIVVEKGRTIYIIGRSDPIIVGDNFRILEFTEMKSKKGWPYNFTNFVKAFGKEVPLAAAKVQAGKEGLISINHLIQLSIGVKVLRDQGMKTEKKRLFMVDRNNWSSNLSILLSDAEVDFLYDIGVYWTQVHDGQLQHDKPPEPEFWMGWECGYCPFKGRCGRDGGERRITEVMSSVNDNLAAANRPAARP